MRTSAKVQKRWEEASSKYQAVIAELKDIDTPDRDLCKQFDNFKGTLDSAVYQVNKLSITDLLGRKMIDHPVKGATIRGHLAACIETLSAPAFKDVMEMFEKSEAPIMARTRELLAMPRKKSSAVEAA